MTDEEWVSILVPISRVRELYGLILERPAVISGAGDGQAGPAEPMLAEPMLADTVRGAYLESQAPLRKFFDLLAARPDEWVSTEEVVVATGLTPRQWSQQLSALARKGRKRYRKERGWWPFQSEKLYESGRQIWRYRMPTEYADIIRSLA